MLKISLASIVSSCSAVLLIAAPGTQALAEGGGSQVCRNLQTDITAIKLSLGALGGKVDQSNADLAAISQSLGLLDGKVDRSNADLAALRQSLGLLEGKVDQSNLALGAVQAELGQIREVLQSQLRVEVEVDDTACASGAAQCSSTTTPSSSNQMPVAVNLLVLRGQQAVTDLGSAEFSMMTAFGPRGGTTLAICANGENGCGSEEFFVNRGQGLYQMWMHPPTTDWAAGTYTLLTQVKDTNGNTATKLVRVSISAGGPSGPPSAPPPPITDVPGHVLGGTMAVSADH